MTKDNLFKMLVGEPKGAEDSSEIPVKKDDNGDGTETISCLIKVGDGADGTSPEWENGDDAVAQDESKGEGRGLESLDCEVLGNRRLATRILLSSVGNTNLKASMLDGLKEFWNRPDVAAMSGLGRIIASVRESGSVKEDDFNKIKEALDGVKDATGGEGEIYERCLSEVREKIGGLLSKMF